MTQTNFKPENAAEILIKMQLAGIHSMVFGGFAADAIRQRETRKHGDLDIYVYEPDIAETVTLLEDEGFKGFNKGNLFNFERKGENISIIKLRDDKNYLVSQGNKSTTYFPIKLFEAKNIGFIDDTAVLIAPNEVLKFEMQFSDYQEDIDLVNKLKINKELYNQIRCIPFKTYYNMKPLEKPDKVSSIF